jgi:hypothetical protein
VAGLVEDELKVGVEALPSYVQDSADFLRKLEEAGPLEQGEFMFTMDVVSLYPSVPRDKAREAMRKNLDRRGAKKIPTEDLLELADMVLDGNEFSFEERRFLLCEGTAIGSKLGRNYAGCYLGEWESEVMAESMRQMGKKPSEWWRFVDDVKGRWKGTKEEFVDFVGIYNNHEARIKVTFEVCEAEAVL